MFARLLIGWVVFSILHWLVSFAFGFLILIFHGHGGTFPGWLVAMFDWIFKLWFLGNFERSSHIFWGLIFSCIYCQRLSIKVSGNVKSQQSG